MPPSPLVVRAHDEGEVLDGDDHVSDQNDERQDAEDVVAAWRHAVRPGEALLERVERAGADVAVDDAERAEGELREGRAARRGARPRMERRRDRERRRGRGRCV